MAQARPHWLPWKATDEEREIVCTAPRATNFPFDDPTVVVCRFLPHLNRDSIWRIFKTAGLNRRPKPPSEQPAKSQGSFPDYDLGFVHIDIEHLPKLETAKMKDANGIYLEVVKHHEAKRGFVMLPRRWVVERSFA